MGDLLQGAFGPGQEQAQEQPQAAGAPAPSGPEPRQLTRQLETLDAQSRRAVERLHALPAGAVDLSTHQGLLNTYATIQANIADVAERVPGATGEVGLEVQKDTNELQTQVQEFSEGVEAQVKQAGGVPRTSGAKLAAAPETDPRKRQARTLLFGVLVAGVGATAYGIYQMRKEAQGADDKRKKRKSK